MSRIVFGVAILICTLAPCLGQAELEAFTGAYSPGSTSIGDVDLDGGPLVGFRAGKSFVKILATEFSYTFIAKLDDPSHSFTGNGHLLNSNFIIQAPIDHFVPFATVGAGMIISNSEGLINLQSAFAWNVGGGLKLRKLAGPVGLRFDVRYYRVPNSLELPSNLGEVDFDFAEASGGLLITFD